MPEPPGEPRWLDDHEMRAWRALLRAQGLLTDRLDGELVAEAEAVLVARDRDSARSRPLSAAERSAFERAGAL